MLLASLGLATDLLPLIESKITNKFQFNSGEKKLDTASRNGKTKNWTRLDRDTLDKLQICCNYNTKEYTACWCTAFFVMFKLALYTPYSLVEQLLYIRYFSLSPI